MNKELPLVSVIVITYNSAKTVLETLDSIYEQTYPNIELIISDDCSKDNTIEICKNWIDNHKSRLINVELIETTQNTGVSPNLNRGIKQSKGKWIKSLAGDDTLTPDSIFKFIEFVLKNNCQICVSDLNLFSDEKLDLIQTRKIYDRYYNYLKEDYKHQLNRIYREYTIPGPGLFYSRWIYDLIDGFDEKYPFCEEWPFAYKILKKGFKFYPCSEKLVNYRISNTSLCRESNNGLGNYRLYCSIKDFYFDYLQKELLRKGMLLLVIDKYLDYKIMDAKYTNKKEYINIIKILSPLKYWRKIRMTLNNIVNN